jgi:hypothetical protein
MNQAQAQQERQDQHLLGQLEEAARALGMRVRVERGSFRSGRCRSRDEELVILNRRLSTRERVQVLARILAGEDLERTFLKPSVRGHILELGGLEATNKPSDPATEAEFVP